MSIIIIAALILAVSIPAVVVGVLLTLYWHRSKLSDLEGQVDATAGHLTGHLSPKSAILGLTSDCNAPSTGFSVLQPAPLHLIATDHPVSPKEPCDSMESSLVLREQLASLFSWSNSFGDDEDVDVVESVDGIVWPGQAYSVHLELLREFNRCKEYLELATQSAIIELPDPVPSETCSVLLPKGPKFPSDGSAQEPRTLLHGTPFRDEEELGHAWLDQSYTLPTDIENVTGRYFPHVENIPECPQPHSVVVEFLNTPMERMLLEEFEFDYMQYTIKLHASVDPALYITPPEKPEPSPTSVSPRLASRPQSSSPSSSSPRKSLASSFPAVPLPSVPPRKRRNSGLSRLGLKPPPSSPPPESKKSSSAKDFESRTSTTTLKRPSPLRNVCDFGQPDRTKVFAMLDRFNRVSSGHRSHKPRRKPGSHSKLLPKEVEKRRRFSGGYRSALLKTTSPPPPYVKAKVNLKRMFGPNDDSPRFI